MREFDENGLRIAEFQAKIFEKSVELLDCSTKIFLRRFFRSDLLKKMDKNDSVFLTLDPIDGLFEIERQFGKTDYGKVKESKEKMFWIGYFYRYISYTRQTKTHLLIKWFPFEQLSILYSAYHTQDLEWCVRSLLIVNHLSENIFDPNWRLKQAMQKQQKQTNQN